MKKIQPWQPLKVSAKKEDVRRMEKAENKVACFVL